MCSQYSIGEGLRDLPNENDSKRTDKLNRYTGPTTQVFIKRASLMLLFLSLCPQDLLEQLRSVQVDADVAPNLQNGSVASLGKRIEDIIDSLERFFNVHPSQLRPQMPPRSTGHIMGDTTQLVAAAAPLLRIIHANGLRGGDVLINRVLDVLTASTIVATDRKGLKFSTSQIAKFLSTFRFLNPSSNPSARRLLRVLAARCGSAI